MRRHAKASTATSAAHETIGLGRANRRPALILSASILTLAALLSSVAPASAATITDRPLLFRFSGSDSTAGAFGNPRGIAVDEAAGIVYVEDQGKNVVDKFNSEGEARPFSATGSSSLDGRETPEREFHLPGNSTIAVDNSSVHPGRIYIVENNTRDGKRHIDAFSPSGEFLWQLALEIPALVGLAVDAEGHLWASSAFENTVREYAATGTPPAEIASMPLNASAGPIAVDANGALYSASVSSVEKYVGGIFDSTLDAEGGNDVAADESNPSGHVATLHDTDLNEYDSAGTLIGTFGSGTIYATLAMDYDASLDRLYVVEFPDRVVALGPAATGVTPDATSQTASGVGVSTATLNGTVNPQSVPNNYYFEWTQGTSEEDWGRSESSAPQSLPEDSADHTVSLNINHLRGDTSYQARVVGVNSTTGLRSISAPVTFHTSAPSTAPAVTIGSPDVSSPSAVEITGTIDPREDFSTTWNVSLSTDPACASGYSSQPPHNLESEADSAVPVSEELTGLLPSQHYCARISARNGAGSTTSETKEFTTAAILPDEISTAFVAPRTDSAARLNGRVNPEGAPFTYRFEYSEDGGVTWTALAEQEETSEAREQLVVASELSGLKPATTYEYRLAGINNEAGSADPGATKLFTTRSSAEMNPPPRGIELVNNPDKGNQNVIGAGPGNGESTISESGDRVLWAVPGGAPGGSNGTFNSFLAERTASGWVSRSIAPPADKQVGGGNLTYALEARTPAFSSFVFGVAQSTVVLHSPHPVLVRVDEHQNQDVLNSYDVAEFEPNAVEVSESGNHVLLINPITGQLEDIGGGAPEVLSIMPGNTEASCGVHDYHGTMWRPGYHLMSATDASRVYFQAAPNGDCTEAEGLYMRNRDTAETIQIDPGSFPKNSEFIRATPDGREAYFATASPLDPNDENEDYDVYRWSEASRDSTCLTCVANADVDISVGASQNVSPVVISDDYSHIYFESHRQLVAGQGKPGAENIYVLAGGRVRFVADPEGGALGYGSNTQLSADGNALVFSALASRRLTADNTASECIEPVQGSLRPCLELYRYEDSEGSLECVSCRRGGLTTHSEGSPRTDSRFDFQPSRDGSTVAFVTKESLTTSDVNQTTDVYVWRDGALRLVTDGVSDQPGSLAAPQVIGTDGDGSNVLFAVVPPEGGLTGFEQDGLLNLYDARIGGGFEPPSPPPHCNEDSCQGPLQNTPEVAPTSSSSFSGHGNLAPKVRKRRRCAHRRGRARRRCVRRHRRHSHRAGAHHDTRRAK